MKRLLLQLAVLLLVVSWSAAAMAQPPPPATVIVHVEDCPGAAPVALDPFVAILTAELRADGVERVLAQVPRPTAAPREPGALAVIDVRADPCEASPRELVVHIADDATRKQVERRVQLSDVAEPSRPRALALAVAETLRASWMELEMPDAPPPAVPVPPAVREAVVVRTATIAPDRLAASVPPDRASTGPDVSLALAWRAFPSPTTSTFGGRAALQLPLGGSFALVRFDAGALLGAARDVLGDVSLGEAAAGAALLFASPRGAVVSAELGPRVEAGAAWASGNAAAASTSSYAGAGFVSAASLLGGFRYRMTPAWRIVLELEAGATIVPFDARADQRRVTGIDGAFFGMALGLAQLR
jgi:hypothetical protein